mgnify:CR=1 FL=1
MNMELFKEDLMVVANSDESQLGTAGIFRKEIKDIGNCYCAFGLVGKVNNIEPDFMTIEKEKVREYSFGHGIFIPEQLSSRYEMSKSDRRDVYHIWDDMIHREKLETKDVRKFIPRYIEALEEFYENNHD